MQALTSWADVAFSSAERDRHLGIRPVSQLNTWPVVSPVNASRRPSRDAAHHSGSGWLARPSPWRTFTSYSLPASLALSQMGQFRPWKSHSVWRSAWPRGNRLRADTRLALSFFAFRCERAPTGIPDKLNAVI